MAHDVFESACEATWMLMLFSFWDWTAGIVT